MSGWCAEREEIDTRRREVTRAVRLPATRKCGGLAIAEAMRASHAGIVTTDASTIARVRSAKG